MGEATAALLARDGHTVITVDLRNADIIADLGTPDGRRTAVDAVTGRAGGALDGLVTYAGMAGLPDRPGDILVAVNYFGSVELLKGLRPALARGTNAAAVAISSNSTTSQPAVPVEVTELCLAGDESGARAAANQAGSLATYPATKLGIARFVRRNAPTPDWIGAGITLNAVAPGFIETPMTDEGKADPVLAPLLEQFPIPVGRPGHRNEIASLVAYLLGPNGRFFCGSVLFCDGGTDALLRPNDWPMPM
jgi:NAD(P)-dependent dehydrogenase (short-subunit alcohol dehydrogenase family)